VEKKLHGTQTSQLLVPEGDPGWKKIGLQDTQTSSAEALVWTRKKLHDTQTIDYHSESALEKSKLHGTQTMYNIAPKSPPWVGRK